MKRADCSCGYGQVCCSTKYAGLCSEAGRAEYSAAQLMQRKTCPLECWFGIEGLHSASRGGSLAAGEAEPGEGCGKGLVR